MARRPSDFLHITSKKKLEAGQYLTPEQFDFVKGIKGIFTVDLHKDKRYMAITLYQEKNKIPQYSYLVVDLDTKAIEQAKSIKLAKQMIIERIPSNAEKTPDILDTPTTSIPRPSCDEVDRYLHRWNTTPDYFQPEVVLKKLFTETCPYNKVIDDIILKTAALNTVYNTYIYSVYPVAQHILSLGIDERLRADDETLVNELMRVFYNSGEKVDHYSFATKYCSFHNPDAFPIYDSYVGKILQYYRDRERFSLFKNSELKNYPKFKQILSAFRRYFGLEKYTTKELDQYLWQFGKEHF